MSYQMKSVMSCHIAVTICDKSEIFTLTVQPVAVLSTRRHKTHGSETKCSLLFTIVAESRVLAFVWTGSSSVNSTRQCKDRQKIAAHIGSYILQKRNLVYGTQFFYVERESLPLSSKDLSIKI